MRTVEKWIGLACGLNTFTQYPCRSFELRISLTGLLCIYKWIHLLVALYGDHLDLYTTTTDGINDRDYRVDLDCSTIFVPQIECYPDVKTIRKVFQTTVISHSFVLVLFYHVCSK